MISVIMPVYNCALYVAEAVQSILNQTYTNFELIIIDDNSTDGTKDTVKSFSDNRIRFIKKPKNTGYPKSLNMGIDVSCGELIARMDGDDISNINRFDEQVKFLEMNPDIAVCGSWYRIISTDELIKYPQEHEEIKIALLDYCALGHPTIMLRKCFLSKHHLRYDETLEPAEDYDLWTRIAALGKLANIPKVLLNYRVHSNQVSIKDQSKQHKNGNVSKQRMLFYILENPSEVDETISNLIIQKKKIECITDLYSILNWLDCLLVNNKLLHFFKQTKFEKYIKTKQADSFRMFYIHNKVYNPMVLYQFMKLTWNKREWISVYEMTRFIVKCLILWKLNPKA